MLLLFAAPDRSRYRLTKPVAQPLNGANSVTTTTPDPCEFIGFGGGSGQNPFEFIGILTTTTTEPYEFIRFRGGGTDRIPAAYTASAAAPSSDVLASGPEQLTAAEDHPGRLLGLDDASDATKIDDISSGSLHIVRRKQA